MTRRRIVSLCAITIILQSSEVDLEAAIMSCVHEGSCHRAGIRPSSGGVCPEGGIGSFQAYDRCTRRPW